METRPALIWLQAGLREPLVAFLLVGGALFGIDSWLRESAEPVVVVENRQIEELVAVRSELLGRALLESERRDLVQEYVDREVLVREAVARGLHRRDGFVRERLVEKMYFLLDEEPEPSDEDLEALLLESPEAYRTLPAISFEHVFHTELTEAADRDLAALREGASQGGRGEPFWLGPTIERITGPQLQAVLGARFARALFDQAVGVWTGPVRSQRGWHLVRVVARHDPRPLPEPQRYEALRRDWIALEQAARRERRLESLRSQYRIEVGAL